ncbi:MAG: threonine synthase [Candidatus Njordarchaeia archaeon]
MKEIDGSSKFFRCTKCGRVIDFDSSISECPFCGGILTVEYNYSEISKKISKEVLSGRPNDISRYRELLPLEFGDIYRSIMMGEAGTPLISLLNIPKILNVSSLFIKNETMNPTGSFIDRGVVLEIINAKKLLKKSVTAVSTGNLGVSVASYANRAGLKANIIIPTKIEIGKLYQLLTYDVNFIPVENEAKIQKVIESTDSNSYIIKPANPFFMEGEKTIAFEIIEQLNWDQPDYIIIPMGTGSLLFNIWRGLKELKKVGLIENLKTKLVGVQIEGCDPIVKAFNVKEFKSDLSSNLVIADLCIKKPSHGQLALNALYDSKGKAVSVNDLEILEALRLFARSEGIIVEPAAATTLAAYKKMLDENIIGRKDTVVLLITGGGLKNFTLIKEALKRRKPLLSYAAEGEIVAPFVSKFGLTKIRILELFQTHKTLHGYEIWKKLKQKYGLDITTTTVYQHIKELQKMGLITKAGSIREGGRSRVLYKLTEDGEEIARELIPEF